MANETISRKEFMKKASFGALGIVATAAALFHSDVASAATKTTVRDNLTSGAGSTMGGGGGAVIVSSTAPNNKGALWIDTSRGGRGVAKYWTGSTWSPTASLWDE